MDIIITKTINSLENATAGIEKLSSLDPDQARAAQWELADMMEWLRELKVLVRQLA